ncbi:MAG: tRNA epoxyqueuosine(34) reductase QueG, partial [Bacteroides sp.]
TPELQPSEALMLMEEKDWCTLTLEQYRTLFKGSAVKRAKYEGLMKNLKKS